MDVRSTIFFIFMQFLANILPKNRLVHSPFGVAASLCEKSSIRHRWTIFSLLYRYTKVSLSNLLDPEIYAIIVVNPMWEERNQEDPNVKCTNEYVWFRLKQ